MSIPTPTSGLVSRPPIVAVLGHVDHGKTSLLDSIRESNIASREAGGITQSIGASTVRTKEGKEITFIDTPGHAAFSQMRSRGSKIADIAVLVVAADDGPKPQTVESWEIIQSAKIPCIVVFTKIDLPSASIDEAYPKLEKLGIYFEGRGGQIPHVGVSSKNKQGINDLIEMILLVSEVSEIKTDPGGPLEAVVIETTKDKRGLMSSVVVRNGTLNAGQEVWVDGQSTKIKGIFDANAKPIKQVLSGFAGAVLGFSVLPVVGSVLTSISQPKQQSVSTIKKTRSSGEAKFSIFVKTKTAGSLEALIASIPADVYVSGSGVGDVTESDVLFAKSTHSKIFLFEAKAGGQILRLAETEGVEIENFDIIYKLIERLDEIVRLGEVKIAGSAQIIAIFPYENRKVAGSKIISGSLKLGDKVKITRNDKLLGVAKIISMRKQKTTVSEAKQGEELGIIFEPQFAFEVADMIISEAK